MDDNDVFGDWKLDRETNTIVCTKPETGEYYMHSVASKHQALDWICHMMEKTWMTPQMLHDLVKAMQVMYGDLRNLPH